MKHLRPFLLAWAALALLPAAQAVTPAELLAVYTAQAGAPASAERGQKLFTTNFGRDFGWSCSSCHGAKPTATVWRGCHR